MESDSESSVVADSEDDEENTAPMIRMPQRSSMSVSGTGKRKRVSFKQTISEVKTYYHADDNDSDDEPPTPPAVVVKRPTKPKPARRPSNATITEAAPTESAKPELDKSARDDFRRETELARSPSASSDHVPDSGDFDMDMDMQQLDDHQHDRAEVGDDEQEEIAEEEIHEPDEPGGRRYSRRKRFRPLDYHLGERVHYQRSSKVRACVAVSHVQCRGFTSQGESDFACVLERVFRMTCRQS